MTLEEFDIWTQSIQETEDRKLKEIFMRARLKIAAHIDAIPAPEADDQLYFLTFAECSRLPDDRDNNEEK